MDRATSTYAPNAALAGANNVQNLLLFVDDDLRETAMALTRIEEFLMQTMKLLDSRSLERADVQSAANDLAVLEHLDVLSETIESLRRRLAKLSMAMR